MTFDLTRQPPPDLPGVGTLASYAKMAEVLGTTPEAVQASTAKMVLGWRKRGQAQAEDLMREGWTFEVPSESGTEPQCWYWRRPGPRGGTLFRSTNQAYRAMMRGKGEEPVLEG